MKTKILYAEDDPIDRLAFERLTTPIKQLEVDYANNVGQLEFHVNQNEYDIIFSDFFIGLDTAFDVAKLVRPKPMVVLTGLHPSQLPVKDFPQNILGFYSKPLNFDELLLIIDCMSPHNFSLENNFSKDLNAVKSLDQLIQHSTIVKAEVVSIFRNSLQETIPNIRSLIEKSEYQQIGLIAHRLKSVFRTLDLKFMLQEATFIEIQCQSLVTSNELSQRIKKWTSQLEELLKNFA